MPQVDAQKNKTLAQKVLEKGLRFKRAYKKAKEELEAAKTREIALQRQLQEQRDLVAQLRAQNTKLESKPSQDETRITELTNQNQQLEQLASQSEIKEAELEAIKEQAQQDAEIITRLTSQAQHKDSELEKLQTDLAEKERALTEQSQRLTSELKTKEAELGDLREQSLQDAERIADLTCQAQQKGSELEGAKADLAEKEKALMEQTQGLTTQLEAKEAELEALKEKSQQDAENKELTEQPQGLTTQIETKEAELRALEEQSQRDIARIKELTEQTQQLTSQVETKEAELETLKEQVQQNAENASALAGTNEQLETENEELAEQVKNLKQLVDSLVQVLVISERQDYIQTLIKKHLVPKDIIRKEFVRLKKENKTLQSEQKHSAELIKTLEYELEQERHTAATGSNVERETKAELTDDEVLRKENQDLQQRLNDQEDTIRELIQELEQMSQEMEVLKVQQSSVSAIEIDADDEVLVESKKEVKSKLAEPLDPLKIHNERIKQIAQRIDYIRTPQFNRLFKKLEKLDLRLVGNVSVLSASLNRFRAALEETVENQFEAKALYLSQLLKLQMLDIQMQTEKNKKTKDQLQKQRVKLFKEIMEEMKEQVSKARYLDSENFLENLDSSSSWSALQKIKALVAWNEKSLEKEREYMQNRNGFITSESDKKYAEFISSAESLLGQLLTTVQDIQNALVDIDLSGIEIQRKKKVHKTKRPEIAPKTSSVIIPIPPRPPAPPENQKRVVSSTRSDDDNRAKKVAVAAPVDLLSQIQAGGVPLRDSKARELASAAPKPKTVWDGIEEKIKDKFQNTLSDSEDETDDWSSDEEYGSSGDEARQSSELPLGANPAILLSSPSGQHTVSSSAQPALSPPRSSH